MEESTGAPPEYASVASLLTPIEGAETRDVKLSSGMLVSVRGLTRKELLDSGQGDASSALTEARMAAACLVKPKMSLAQVQQWQGAPGSVKDFGEVTTAIRDLSGIKAGADKSDVDPAGD